MKQSFALAAFAGVAVAGPGNSAHGLGNKLERDPAFVNFVGKYNKDVRDAATFERKLLKFHENQGIIQSQNRKADQSGNPKALRLALNWTADLEHEEYLALLGLNTAAAEQKKTSMGPASKRSNDSHGRGLVNTATNVDHVADGFIHPVKNQGQCGSCWAFGATTVLEGTLAKKTNSAPVRLSEQQMVDCTLTNNSYNMSLFNKDYYNWGCEGGWMSDAWDFMKDHGIMKNSDYGYTSGNSGVETQCAHNASKVVGKVQNWGQITTTIDDIKAKLQQQPLSVALDASSSAWQLYSSGVVTAADGCGTSLNHAVVLVGFTESGSAPGPAPGPEPGPTPGPTPTPDAGCNVTKWWHTCDSTGSRRLQDVDGNDNYWKVQNQWGTNWGDNGFILIDITDGLGVCGINSVVEWVEMANAY